MDIMVAGVVAGIAAGVETMLLGVVAGELAIQYLLSILQSGEHHTQDIMLLLLVISCGDNKTDLNDVKLFFL